MLLTDFATGLFIPVLVTFMGILRQSKDVDVDLTTEQAAQYVMDHMFNHTTVSSRGQQLG